MKKRQSISAVLFLAVALGVGWAQSNSGQPASSDPQSRTEPAPALGPGTVPVGSDENPPISGLDQPSLEPRAAVRSFLIPGASVSEAVDSNVAGASGNASVDGVTRALGSLTLQRLWSRYDLAMDYGGGIAYYSNRAINAAQIQALDLDQRVQWRTGQLVVRDSFSYLPEGQFGFGSYGGAGALGGFGGGGGLAGGNVGIFPGQGASLGQDPRITNRTIVDVTEGLSPRSSLTAAGSYGLVHFTNNTPTMVNGVLVSGDFIDSRQVSAQAGYNYQMTRKDQLAVVYGYQSFRYPNSVGSNFDTNLINLLYGHRITGRMDFVIGGGPQWTNISSTDPLTNKRVTSNQLNLSGRALLRYRFPRTSVGLYYDHYNTNGSGFFAGAKSDVARLTATRPFGRLWTSSVDVGYTHNDRLALALIGPIPSTASSYGYVYAGGALRRQLSREFSAFLSYQFNYLGFDSSFCTNGIPCSRTGQRHVAIAGVDWHPHPIRLD